MNFKPALALWLMVSFGASAAEIPDYPFIFVVGTADIDTPPNVASCSLTIRDRNQNAGKAASTVEDRLKMVLKTLSTNRIASADIESFSIEKQALTDDRYDGVTEAVIKGYDVWRRVKFTVRSLSALPPVETALVRAPNVFGIDCQFSRIDRQAVEEDLQTKALLSAREQADKMAAPLGRHIVAPVAVSKVGFDAIAGRFGLRDQNADLEKLDRMFKRSVGSEDLRGDELLVPATIHMTVSVNVLFKME